MLAMVAVNLGTLAWEAKSTSKHGAASRRRSRSRADSATRTVTLHCPREQRDADGSGLTSPTCLRDSPGDHGRGFCLTRSERRASVVV